MSMNQMLAERYGTNGTTKEASAPSAEEVHFQQQADYFAKVAAHNGLDLEKLSEQEIQFYWNQVFPKTAAEGSEESEEEKKEKENKAKAKAEHEEKKANAQAWEEAIAQGDRIGRASAHSMVDELRKIAAASAEAPAGKLRHAGSAASAPGKARAAEVAEFTDHGKSPSLGGRTGFKAHAPDNPNALHGAKKPGKLTMLGRKVEEKAKDVAAFAKKHKTTAAIAAGALAAGAGAGALASRKKEAGAFEVEAAKLAFELAQELYDNEQLADRLNEKLAEGGLPENEKLASADFETALAVRAHEYLEAIGVPVDWNQSE